MIRPSALQVAEHCDLSPVLSQRFPSRSEATDRGNHVDAAVMTWLTPDNWGDAILPEDRDARACCEWIAESFARPEWRLEGQKRVELRDDDTGAVITAGTADIVATGVNGDVVIIDLKKWEQWIAGRLAEPDQNLQLHAYALAATPAGVPYRTCILLFGDGQAEPLWSRPYTDELRAPILERIREINSRTGEPMATKGPHCSKCYPREYCPSWALPAYVEAELIAPGTLVPMSRPGGLETMTPKERGNAYQTIKAVKELADKALDRLKAFRDEAGPGSVQIGDLEYGPVTSPGRVSVDQAALERDGLIERYARIGRPYTTYRLHRPRKEAE